MLFNFQGTKALKTSIAKANELFRYHKGAKKVSVTNAEGPPVPIPNTEVKLCSGENTSREAVREDSPMLT